MRGLGFTLLPLLAFAVAGCGKSYTYKYRLTVSIRDHGELKSVSNVVSVQESPTLTHGISPPKLCGEAALLRLRNGKSVFALLKGAPHEMVADRYQWLTSPTIVLLKRLGLETQWSWKDDSGIRRLREIRTTISLQPYEMPDFVTFRDIHDPTTIERVDPENTEETLGNGVKIEKVTLQVTNEEVSRGHVGATLPWLDSGKDYLDGSKWGDKVQGFLTSHFVNCDKFTE